MKIYIIRHGETALNAKGVMQGRLNEPINENGRELARVTGQALRGVHFDECFCSPLDRARETAEILLRESGNDIPIQIDERIIEISFGEFEGRRLEEMDGDSEKFFTDPFHFVPAPSGETIQDVCDRTQAFLHELMARDDDKTYLVSTHGCAMRAMTNDLMENPADYWMGHAPYNCSFTIVDVTDGKPTIEAIDKVYYDQSLVVDRYKK